MANLEFSSDELLEQARGNQTAIWHLAVRWARENGSVDDWGSFVGDNFAPSWDEMADRSSAVDVARMAGLNIATTADMRPVDLSGDASRAVLTVEGPEEEWIERMGTDASDLDRTTELIFRPIAERRGLTFSMDRDGSTFTLTFAREG